MRGGEQRDRGTPVEFVKEVGARGVGGNGVKRGDGARRAEVHIADAGVHSPSSFFPIASNYIRNSNHLLISGR